MAPPHQKLPLAVRSALARLQGEEARALASHSQLRRLAAAAAFDAATDLSSVSPAASASSSEASRSLDAVVDACLSHGSEVSFSFAARDEGNEREVKIDRAILDRRR